VIDGKEQEGAKFADYFDYAEPLARCPRTGHWRCSAGATRACCTLDLEPDEDADPATARSRATNGDRRPLRHRDRWPARPTAGCATRAAGLAGQAAAAAPRAEGAQLREAAEDEAIGCSRATCATCCWPRRPGPADLGLDPGCAPGSRSRWSTPPARWSATDDDLPARAAPEWDELAADAGRAGAAHTVELIAIGNGTASRETDRSPPS
jgi:protein Tex